ncbi:MAG: aminotransferase class V-fold PLP-dependent enzyme [Ignavibacteria bacterium]|nr:aminotransferase class V-fold PLP-dependent enzyme [Ignavibacteria bacterium]
MTGRREFVKSFGLLAVSSQLFNPKELIAASANDEQSNKTITALPKENLSDKDFWAFIQQSYTASPNIINLNNGGCSPQPKIVQEAFENYNRMCNEAPSYYMWRILDQGRDSLRMKLADLAGCSPDEVSICRNTTEALDNIIFGLKLNKGDEVVLTKQDYPNVINAWKFREKRDGIIIKWVNLDVPTDSEDVLVSRYEEAFNSRTKAVNITHIINWNGQIVPAAKIAEKAHARGIEVIIDAAHSFAHLDYKIPNLGGDYVGTSLHKWLSAPFGTGLLYIKKDKIRNITPLMPNAEPESGDIRKFESLGTRSFPAEMAIGTAIDFQLGIGSARKYERLKFLRNYWYEQAAKLPRVQLNTSLKPEFANALSNFGIEGMKSADIANILFDKYRIHSVSIDWENIHGVRITPHVYTKLNDLDRLLTAINDMVKK